MKPDRLVPMPTPLLRSERDPLPLLAGRPRHELEFLPAALEIMDTPAHPAAHMITGVICAFCAVAITWSVIGRIDIVANASGTIIPAGKTRLVQPMQTATVEQVLVADGDHVEAGQPVVRLDAIDAAADRDRLAADLAAARLDVAGLTALRDDLSHPQDGLVFHIPADAAASDVARAQATIASRRAEQIAKLADLSQQMAEKRAEAVENDRTIDKLRTELPMLAGVRDMYRTLYASALASRIDLLSSEQRFSDTAHDLAIQIEHGGESQATLSGLARQYEAQQSDYAHGVLQDLDTASQKRAELEAQYRAAAHQAAQTVLRAPAAGTVQQLSVHGGGGVVTPAERLMVIVPDHDALVVEAMVGNRDIGFVRPGQPVNVKIGAYSFTRYGMIRGHVVTLSRDAVDDAPHDSQAQADAATGTSNAQHAAGSEPDLDGGEGSGYVARIALDRDSIAIDGRVAQLAPGMSVTAEILTGRRRVISYLLSPLMRYSQNAGRER